MPVFTSRRTLDASSSTVENAGSSNDAFTSISSATLIRSGGSFLTSAAERTAASATARARRGSWNTPRRPRTSCRCAFTFRVSHHAAVACDKPSPRRTCSTTATGTSLDRGKYPSCPKHTSDSTSENRCSSERVCSRAHATSSSEGLNDASSRAVTRRRNRGYAVRSIDAIRKPPEGQIFGSERNRCSSPSSRSLLESCRSIVPSPSSSASSRIRVNSTRSSPETPCSRSTSCC